MGRFVIDRTSAFNEWVAEEKDYFSKEGLDYDFNELIQSTGGQHHNKGDKFGAFQSIEKGRKADVSCACHWTINVAAAKGYAKLYADVYSVAPSGVFVPAIHRSNRRRTSLACRSPSATSRAAIFQLCRPSNSTCPPKGSF